jgi:hypothetical protein
MHPWRVEIHEEALIQLEATLPAIVKGAHINIYSVYSFLMSVSDLLLAKGPGQRSFIYNMQFCS